MTFYPVQEYEAGRHGEGPAASAAFEMLDQNGGFGEELVKFVAALHGGLSTAVDAIASNLLFVRSEFGPLPYPIHLLHIDVGGGVIENLLDIDDDGQPDLGVTVTPEFSVADPGGGSGLGLRGVHIAIRTMPEGRILSGLRLDLGVRLGQTHALDGPFTDARQIGEYVVVRLEAPSGPFPERLKATLRIHQDGEEGTAGYTSRIIGYVESRMPGIAPPGATLAIGHWTWKGPTRPVEPRVPPRFGLPDSIRRVIRVPNESSEPDAHDELVAEIVRPEAAPNLFGLPAELHPGGAPLDPGIRFDYSETVLQATPTKTTRFSIRVDSIGIGLRLTTIEHPKNKAFGMRSNRLPTRVEIDYDPMRSWELPQFIYTANDTLGDFDMRAEDPDGASALRHMAIRAAEVPVRIGLRLGGNAGADAPLRVFGSDSDNVYKPMPSALGRFVVVGGRDIGTLPPAERRVTKRDFIPGLDVNVPWPAHAITFDLDDTPPSSVLPARMVAGAQDLVYLRVEERPTHAQDAQHVDRWDAELVHADEGAGLVVDLRRAPTLRPGVGTGTERPLRLQVYKVPAPTVAEKEHASRLIVRAGSIPDRLVIDYKHVAAQSPADSDYVGLRVSGGECKHVQALFVDKPAEKTDLLGAGRISVAMPNTPHGFVDVARDHDGALQVTSSETVQAFAGLALSRGLDAEGDFQGLLKRMVMHASLPPTPDDGAAPSLRISASAGTLAVSSAGVGTSGRIALGETLLLSVRATPQAVAKQVLACVPRPAHLEGGEGGFISRLLRLLGRLRVPSLGECRQGFELQPKLGALSARVIGLRELELTSNPENIPGHLPAGGSEEGMRIRATFSEGRVNRAFRFLLGDVWKPRDRPLEEYRAVKFRAAGVPETVAFSFLKGSPLNSSQLRKPSIVHLDLSERSGEAELVLEQPEIAYEFLRRGVQVGRGVTMLSIDSLPRRMVITQLFDERYAPGLTWPWNWPDRPGGWSPDGTRFQVSDATTIRELFKIGWSKDFLADWEWIPPGSDGLLTSWERLHISQLVLRPTRPIAGADGLPSFFLWTPSRRPAEGGDEGDQAIGFGTSPGVAVTLDADILEHRRTLRIGESSEFDWQQEVNREIWKAVAEIQLQDFEGQVTVSPTFSMLEIIDSPIRDNIRAGKWWLRSVGALPFELGSAGLGSEGIHGLNRTRLFP